MKKIYIVVLICCLLLGISGCGDNDKIIKDTSMLAIESEKTDKKEFSTENEIESLKHLEDFSAFSIIPINDEDYHNYMNGYDIASQEIYYDEEKEKVMNKVVCTHSIDNVWYSVELYYDYILELHDGEWYVRSEMKKTYPHSYDNEKKRYLQDNISGKYDIYYVRRYVESNEYMVHTKIEEWIPYEDNKGERECEGSVELVLRDTSPFCMDIQGIFGGYHRPERDISNQGIVIYNVSGTVLNWKQNRDGFLVTNKDNPRYKIKLILKENTKEILLEYYDTKDKDGYLYKLILK